MKRARVINTQKEHDDGQWLCEECLNNFDGDNMEIIEWDNDPYGDGCDECGEDADWYSEFED
ncbi:MAG: hypothetical protein JXR78_15700 [Victivallales bacterium]|nr:hypothetical protein [Victivallales bacterium]